MKIKDDDHIISQIKILFEINKDKKININSEISKIIDFDSLNQLKLLGFIDENSKKKLDIKKISKIKKIKDILLLINDWYRKNIFFCPKK